MVKGGGFTLTLYTKGKKQYKMYKIYKVNGKRSNHLGESMLKTISSTDLRASIKEVLNEVEYGNNQYLIEKFGEPSAAIINIENFRLFQAMMQQMQQSNYSEENDPVIALFDGPADLAEQAKEILKREITSTSGWSQKELLNVTFESCGQNISSSLKFCLD